MVVIVVVDDNDDAVVVVVYDCAVVVVIINVVVVFLYSMFLLLFTSVFFSQNVRRVALVTFNSAAHNKPSLIRDLLDQILPQLYNETKVRVG